MNAKECQRAIKGDFSSIQDFTGIHDLRTVNNKTQFEATAGKLLDCDLKFRKVTRMTSYVVDHNIQGRTGSDRCREELIGYHLVRNRHLFLATCSEAIDFQVPLKNTRGDKGLGKVDLLAYNKKTKRLYFMELKRPDNTESVLRCALEAYAYSQIVDREKLISDLKADKRLQSAGIHVDGKSSIIPCMLIFKGREQHEQLLNKENVNTRKLIAKLKIQQELLDEEELAAKYPSIRPLLKKS